jgi:serine/threonine protein kinase
MSNILLVDDDGLALKMLAEWLTYEKFSVTSTTSGVEGWNNARSNKYDLMIFDWDLPDLNGIDILRQLRSSGDRTPVIMLTGRAAVDDKELGFESGATDYVTKPFHMKELTVRIRAILRNYAPAVPRQQALGSNNQAVLSKADLDGTALAGKFEFLEMIGEGGVALVFKAKHPQLDKFVAIKMLQVTDCSDEIIARFEREARLISKLDHPNIVTIHDFGVTERKQPYMIMEFIDGKALDATVRTQGYLPVGQGLSILANVCDAIEYAHQQRILHRDIKPANVMLKAIPNRPPIPKVLDFGLAKLLDITPGKSESLTQAQQILGTPPYLPPELIRGKPVDERSDVYSFGCMVFEVITGYPPFVGDSPLEITMKHLEEPPLTFEEVRPDVQYPAELERFIEKMLEVDPDKRHQSMHYVGLELRRLLESCGSA